MGDFQKTGSSLHLIDLTDDDNQDITSNIPVIDLTGDNDLYPNCRIPEIDLTGDNDQYLNCRIPEIDLTGDNDQYVNYRIPVIDLENDDVQDITDQVQCIDLTHNDALSRNHTFQNFSFRGLDGKATNHSTELIDLTESDAQDFNLNTPVIDLICDNNQFLNCRTQDNDMSNDDIDDITRRLQSFDLRDGKEKNTNGSFQSIDRRIIPGTDLTIDRDCDDDRRPAIDLRLNDDRFIKKPVNGIEMSCNYSPTSFQKGVIENNLRIPSVNLSYDATENDLLNCNETLNMNAMHIDTFNSMQKFHLTSQSFLATHPLKDNFEGRKETILTNRPLRINFKGREEIILTNLQLTNKFEDEKETVLPNPSLANNSEVKYLSSRKSEKISQNKVSDLLKPAHHPIPLRHSFGRSTVNTSQNVPIEYREASEDQFRTETVSSIIRRKKSKSITDISRHNLPNSKSPSTSREKSFSFDAFEGFLRKFWIFLLLTFIALYYWI